MSLSFVTTQCPVSDLDPFAAALTEHSAQGWEIVSVGFENGLAVALLARPIPEPESSQPQESEPDTRSGSGALARPAGAAPSHAVDEMPLPPANPVPIEAFDSKPPEPSPIEFGIDLDLIETDSDEFDLSGIEIEVHDDDKIDLGVVDEDEDEDEPLSADWYADPSGRFAQRYWDGSTWTEHVADDSGETSIDPPVG